MAGQIRFPRSSRPMNDAELLRYSRHILLPEIGIEGQHALRKACVLVIGLGGLGCPASLYLASAGVGCLVLADGDTVDATNLQRQILHRPATLGWPKVRSAQLALQEIAADCRIETIAERLDGAALAAAVAKVDVVLDCSDNFATRHAVNAACVAAGKPLISGAAIRFDGQLAVFDSRRVESPCYHCLFPQGEEVDELRCAVMGVFAPLTGIIGCAQAAEAIKLIIGCGESLVGRLLLLDGLSMRWRELRVPRDAHCPVCATRDAG